MTLSCPAGPGSLGPSVFWTPAAWLRLSYLPGTPLVLLSVSNTQHSLYHAQIQHFRHIENWRGSGKDELTLGLEQSGMRSRWAGTRWWVGFGVAEWQGMDISDQEWHEHRLHIRMNMTNRIGGNFPTHSTRPVLPKNKKRKQWINMSYEYRHKKSSLKYWQTEASNI